MSRKRRNGGLSVPESVTSSVSPANSGNLTPIQPIILIGKNEEQKNLIKSISTHTITIVRGLPGTGKTHVAVTLALQQFLKGNYEKIVLTRPAVEAAGEKLGYLPGDIREKIDPYMLPLYEEMFSNVPYEQLKRWLPQNGNKDTPIRSIPLAYMRGVTLKNAFVIADEMQNSTSEQMRLLLTRLGENSKMVICGDTRQSDIKTKNGLEEAFEILNDIDENIAFVTLTEAAIVRHPLIQKIEACYEKKNKKESLKEV